MTRIDPYSPDKIHWIERCLFADKAKVRPHTHPPGHHLPQDQHLGELILKVTRLVWE